MIQEFKDFINKGDIVDLAVAVVMATAFKPIVDAFVNGVLMQIVAAIFGQPNFDGLSIHWGDQIGVDPDSGLPLFEGQIYYGTVITAIISFLFVALAVFFVVKAYNATKKDEEAAEEDSGPSEVDLLTEIRDSLAAR
ncbi:MAG: large conductance mechanosensitive channel protein MscL [Actinomycetota bacterium]